MPEWVKERSDTQYCILGERLWARPLLQPRQSLTRKHVIKIQSKQALKGRKGGGVASGAAGSRSQLLGLDRLASIPSSGLTWNRGRGTTGSAPALMATVSAFLVLLAAIPGQAVIGQAQVT